MIPFMRHSGKGKFIGTENRSVAIEGWRYREGLTTVGPQEIFAVNCSVRNCWGVYTVHALVKTYRTVHHKRVNFIACKFNV